MQFLVHRQHQKERLMITIMGWFHLLWTVLLAVSVSCQQLTTVLPQDDDACKRNEVTFNCRVRGSQNLTDLILAWSSPEYIGQGDPLRFTTQDTPGANKTSMINRNVTAILISNTGINGMPELVSELRIVGASQTSVITCSSESNQTLVATTFVSSAFPGRPQSGEARERTAGSCDFQVTWDPPANVGRFDIDRYIVYVPSRNIMKISLLTRIDLNIPNCRVGNNSIQVAAVNRLGCIGPNSSHIQLSLLEMQDSPSGGLPPGAVAGIVIAIACVIIALVVPVAIFFYGWKVRIQKRKTAEEQAALKLTNETLLKQDFRNNLMDLYTALRKDSFEDDKLIAVENLSQMMENQTLSKEAVKIALKTIKLEHGSGMKKVLVYLKLNVQRALLSFDNELQDKDTDITMDSLIRAAEQNVHEEVFDELIKIMDNTKPEIVKRLLQTMFEELQKHLQSKVSSIEMSKWVTDLPGGDIPMEFPA